MGLLLPTRRLLLGGGRRSYRYLLRDMFLGDAAAPLTSPRTCEPGPGLLTIVDTNGVQSIANGVRAVNGTPAANDGVISALHARAAGKAFLVRVPSRTTIGANTRWGWGATDLSDGAFAIGAGYGADANTVVAYTGTTAITADSLDAGEQQLAFVQRGTGGYVFGRQGLSGQWKLLWVYNADTNDVYAKNWLGAAAQVWQDDDWRVIDLARYDNRFATDDGLATSVLTNPPARTLFAHTADALIEFNLTFAGGGLVTVLEYRKQDINNRWQISIWPDGGLSLYEVVNGVSTSRGYIAGAIGAGANRGMLVIDGNVHRVYTNNALRITYTDPSNLFIDCIEGRAADLGDGNAWVRVAAFPRTISLPSGI